jgi:alkylated DNA repair dioxygenase AlkB
MQTELFAQVAVPEGCTYLADAITPAQEYALLRKFEELPFAPFQFHGFTGLRRIVSYGFRYDYSTRSVQQAEQLPEFLFGLREAASRLAGAEAATLCQALVTEYAPGAGIGWHRDKREFDKVVAFSLAGAATLRFRRRRRDSWERISIIAEPRSAYVLDGAARTDWQHSIPPVPALRYSVTFRNFTLAALASGRVARQNAPSS